MGSTMLPYLHCETRDMKRTGPSYDRAEVARLARERRVVATLRVRSWLMNHGYDATETMVELLTSLEKLGRWTGSTELMNGEVADEYVVPGGDEDWYVKFYVDGEQVVVIVWSCCWDGAVD